MAYRNRHLGLLLIHSINSRAMSAAAVVEGKFQDAVAVAFPDTLLSIPGLTDGDYTPKNILVTGGAGFMLVLIITVFRCANILFF